MPSQAEIEASNALINDATAPRVSVFAGATSGVGQLTVRALVATGASVRIYLVGRRSAAARAAALIAELEAANPRAEIVWTEAEISLLAEVRRVCELISSKEPRVDLLFLSAGYAPFGRRTETAEGLEVCQSLEYYSRLLFVLRLLPALRAAEAPRVISVLGGGFETANGIDVDDIDLQRPGNFSAVKAQSQYVNLNSAALDKVAADNPHVTFIHASPGWVNTGNVHRGDVDPNSLWAWFVYLFLNPLIRLLAMSDEVSGQRQLFNCTSAKFGGKGVPWTGKPGINTLQKESGGLFIVSHRCETWPKETVMPVVREKAQPKVWARAQEVLGPYL
ncbi:uncharacterized protein E0L32_008955 [Thyridium curvatum]|uniref:Uncharacterized protein n=1 Tax=Thyridium curvatum TaxID=1093900 RepID=A0A507AQ80_9PEZI|nr:uncharacterized protein E0L32_008955 [Thyridium curvatum]TPX09933.1 hypothetical protein E0L32_008955 [Thyridium curvatum]